MRFDYQIMLLFKWHLGIIGSCTKEFLWLNHQSNTVKFCAVDELHPLQIPFFGGFCGGWSNCPLSVLLYDFSSSYFSPLFLSFSNIPPWQPVTVSWHPGSLPFVTLLVDFTAPSPPYTSPIPIMHLSDTVWCPAELWDEYKTEHQ